MNKTIRLRDKQLKFYVPSNEKEVIRDKAKYLDMPVGNYIRKMAIETVIVKTNFNKVFYDLNKIGTNINQIEGL